MSRLLAAAVAALLLFAAIPAYAQEAPTEEPTAEPSPEVTEEPAIIACDNADGLPVLTAEGLQPEVPTPSFLVGNEVESVDVLVDLAATSSDATATVNGFMTWTFALNDYDLEILSTTNGGISENFQPLDPAEEAVVVSKVRHCEVITVNAIDFTAPLVVDTLEVSLALTRIVDPGPTTTGL